MKLFVCENCGSNDFHEDDGYRVCNHCGTKYIITAEDRRIMQSNIELQNDINRLLEKCRLEPARAKKYAQMILEMDPTNSEAIQILSANIKKTQSQKSGGCYVATAVYGSYDCPEVWTLRRYRDYTLAETWYGRAFIHVYYAISPTLVKWFGETEWFKNMWKPKLDQMVKDLNQKGVADTPYQDRNW